MFKCLTLHDFSLSSILKTYKILFRISTLPLTIIQQMIMRNLVIEKFFFAAIQLKQEKLTPILLEQVLKYIQKNKKILIFY